MSDRERFYTRDLPKAVTQLPGRSIFQLPVFNEEGVFIEFTPSEVIYPLEAVSFSLQLGLNAYVALGKVNTQDMQKMVTAGGVDNSTMTGLTRKIARGNHTVFDDYQTVVVDRGTLTSCAHHLMFPGKSLVDILDICSQLDPLKASSVLNAYVTQYFGARNSTLHFTINLYEQWIDRGYNKPLKDLEKNSSKPNRPIVIPLGASANDPVIEIPLTMNQVDIGTSTPKATALIQELEAQGAVTERIMHIYWAMQDCYRALYECDPPNQESDLIVLTNQYFREMSFGLNNLETHIGKQNLKQPHPLIVYPLGTAATTPRDSNTYHQTVEVNSFQAKQKLNALPDFQLSYTSVELTNGESVNVRPLGTCPLPMRALRRLLGYVPN